MKLPAVDNEFIFIGRDPRSSSLFGNKYLPLWWWTPVKKKKNGNIAHRLGMKLIETRLVCWSLRVVKWRRSSLSIRLWFEHHGYMRNRIVIVHFSCFWNHWFFVIWLNGGSMEERWKRGRVICLKLEERSFVKDLVKRLEQYLFVSRRLILRVCFTTTVLTYFP